MTCSLWTLSPHIPPELIVWDHSQIFPSIVCSNFLLSCNSACFPQCPTAHQQHSPVLSSDCLKSFRSRKGETIFLHTVKCLSWLHFPHLPTTPSYLISSFDSHLTSQYQEIDSYCSTTVISKKFNASVWHTRNSANHRLQTVRGKVCFIIRFSCLTEA